MLFCSLSEYIWNTLATANVCFSYSCEIETVCLTGSMHSPKSMAKNNRCRKAFITLLSRNGCLFILMETLLLFYKS